MEFCWAGTAFTPEAGTQAGAAGMPLPPGSPITTCRERRERTEAGELNKALRKFWITKKGF